MEGELWGLSRSSGDVKEQSPGQLISVDVTARFPRERARRSPRVLGCLASLVCTQSAADYGPLLAARVFSQSRLICTDFSGELLEF